MLVEKSMHPEWLSNAFLVAAEGGPAVFVDAGADVAPLIEAAERCGTAPVAILRTHGHHDHVENEDELVRRYSIPVLAEPGDWKWDGRQVRGLATPGHSDDGLSFVVDDGVVATGDTLFRDAVGGGDVAVVRRSVMEVLLELPDTMRVLPGHADETTIGRERREKSFVRAWRGAEDDGRLVVTKPKSEDALEIRLLEVLSDVAHDMGESAALQKDGVERDLQEALAATPEALGEPLTLVRREWQTEIGPVDLMCRDEAGEWVAVEVKRIGTIEGVEQLTRYLDFIRRDPAKKSCRGILVAERLKPQAVALAESRAIHCATVELDVLRGEREPELTLFAACEEIRWPGSCTAAAECGRSL